jgi:hypothetical protein
MMEKIVAFRDKCMEQGWICPQPQNWNRLWELLPDKSRNGSGWEPALPLILAAWSHTSNLEKSIRFDQHLQWASDHGAAEIVLGYLQTLSPEDCHRR